MENYWRYKIRHEWGLEFSPTQWYLLNSMVSDITRWEMFWWPKRRWLRKLWKYVNGRRLEKYGRVI